MRKNRFTLLEVMIVLLVLVILAGVTTPAYLQYAKKARVRTAKSQCGLLADAVKNYQSEVRALPNSLDALVTNVDNASSWEGPYWEGKLPKDPWGGLYVIIIPGKNADFDVVSYGSDGKSGGDGDAGDIFSSALSE